MDRKTRRAWLIAGGLFGFFTVDGLLRFGYKYLQARIDDAAEPWGPYLIDELTGAYGAAVLAPLVYLAVKRLRSSGLSWTLQLPLHLLVATAFSVTHTLWNAATRGALYPLTGFGPHDYGPLALRIPMEYFNDLAGYALWALLLNLFFYYRETRDRELRSARLETELSRARLAGLEARLNPHFLFNTLNLIAEAMHRSVDAADLMITRLGALLRETLDQKADAEIPLDRELELLTAYVEIMKARFGDRLSVRIRVEDGAAGGHLPPMLLQPLVENAIEHGVARQAGKGIVEVSARREAGRLILEVADDGPGLDVGPEEALASGIGLSATLERLRTMYDGKASLDCRDRPEGGALVTVRLPFRGAPG